MPNQILVPSLGESVTEATVSKWLKQVGEEVDSDEPLVELETDKVNIEVPSPLSGTLSSIKVKEGDTVEVGALLGIVNGGKSSSVTTTNEESAYQKSYIPPKTTEKTIAGKKSKKINLKKQEPLELVDVVDEEGKKEEPLILDTLAENEIRNANTNLDRKEKQNYVPPITKRNLSPAVRKIAEENELDISNLEGSGKDGRISKGDLINLMGNNPQPLNRRTSENDKVEGYNCQTFKRSPK